MTDRPTLTLQATTGQALHIDLAAMPGAGMLWHAPAAPAGCRLVDHGGSAASATLADGSGAAGAAGGPAPQRFSLTCAQPGSYTLRFELKRSWEATVHAVQTVKVTAT